MHIQELLRQRLSEREWVLLPEVRNRAGFNATRSADWVAVGLWPSRGMPVLGMEVKSSRGDWLRELRNPAKAETIWRFCNGWVVVQTVPGCVKEEELPDGWGLWTIKEGKCHEVRAWMNRGSQPLSREFIINMLRRASEYVVPPEATKSALEEAERRGRESAELTHRFHNEELQALREKCAEFEKASGIKIDRWSYDLPQLGKVLKAFLGGGFIASSNSAITVCENALAAVKASQALFGEIEAGAK